MDVLFGVATHDFVLLASDMYFRNNVIVSKTDLVRFTKISERAAVIASGNQGDCERTIRYNLESLRFQEAANGLVLTEQTFASRLQKHIHSLVRRKPVEVTALIGGISSGSGLLYTIDQYGALTTTKYAGTGYAGNLFLSAMDSKYRPDMSEEEAIDTIRSIYEGIKNKLVINYGNLHLCLITRNGMREIK
ncbi:20S proteasome subunit beta 4 [Nematocida homosporus]|uniref:20S proteasome subunit beta 4 n=1 Tax=Nematocida homosporus TaxID=1912981 RepID=UPI002220844D|nr:20S proteasome subunit beta 4 [Nematocida homosporus]KAI5184414.1 20S proteasome subunit beta 4 [Nematocida homosporus]